MKRATFYLALTGIIILMVIPRLLAQPGTGQRGQGAGFQYSRMYDAATEETISGEVLKVDRISGMGRRMAYGIQLTVKTAKESIPVHLGPEWYLDQQGDKIAVKDQVTVTGSRVTVQKKTILIAAEVRKGEKVLVLRDQDGFPMWAGWRKGGRGRGAGRGGNFQGRRGGCGGGRGGDFGYDQNSVETLQGTILRVQKIKFSRGDWKGVHLRIKTAKENPLDVHLGPEWYVDQQKIIFLKDDPVEIRGSRIMFYGKEAIVAAEIKRGKDVLKLRDEYGCPAWRGWRRGMNKMR